MLLTGVASRSNQDSVRSIMRAKPEGRRAGALAVLRQDKVINIALVRHGLIARLFSHSCLAVKNLNRYNSWYAKAAFGRAN